MLAKRPMVVGYRVAPLTYRLRAGAEADQDRHLRPAQHPRRHATGARTDAGRLHRRTRSPTRCWSCSATAAGAAPSSPPSRSCTASSWAILNGNAAEQAAAAIADLLPHERALTCRGAAPSARNSTAACASPASTRPGAGPLAGPVVVAAVILDPARAHPRPGRLQAAQRGAARDTLRAHRGARPGLAHRVRRLRAHRPHQHLPGHHAGHARGRPRTGPGAPSTSSSTATSCRRTCPARRRRWSAATRWNRASAPPRSWPRSRATATWSSWTRAIPGTASPGTRAIGVPEHLEALARLGPCPEHRRSFAPVRRLPGTGPVRWVT